MTGWVLPHERESASAARRITAETLTAWGADTASDAAFDLELAVSEGIGNAVTHGAGPVELTLAYDGQFVACEIRDHGTWVPATPGADPEHGRGLQIIAELAEIIKLETGETGTVIVFRVPVPVLITAAVAA